MTIKPGDNSGHNSPSHIRCSCIKDSWWVLYH